MATIAEPAPAPPGVRVAPDRFVIRGVPWELYERLRDLPANFGVRMSFADGDLEFMSPSQPHGEMEARTDAFVLAMASVLRFRCKSLANTTWRRGGEEKAKEADGSFYLANCERVRKKRIDLDIDPPPDLAIEVEVSRGTLDALAIYQAIGVPEVWRFDGEGLRIHLRQADGTFAESDRSLSFPFLEGAEIVARLRRAEEFDDDAAWDGELRAWIAAEVAPRVPAGWKPGLPWP